MTNNKYDTNYSGWADKWKQIWYKLQWADKMKFKSGKKALEKLGFDPIKRQVELFERLTIEDEYWMEVRQGLIFVGDSRVRYSSVMHLGVLSGLNKVANDLIRYGYGRVEEGDGRLNVDKVPPLVINLQND